MMASRPICQTGRISLGGSDPPVLRRKQFVGNGQAQRADVRMALQLHVRLKQLNKEGGLLSLFPAQIGQRDTEFEDLVEFDEADLGELSGRQIWIGYPQVGFTEIRRKLHYNESPVRRIDKIHPQRDLGRKFDAFTEV